ncbi:MAG TPA: 3-deoxy-8-phosphooctulonate synthase [Myxococcota bacterium]|jgi:2-dehydro-3-deoxyphosphooctonate aldolase (KDO 8-P synthase)|nr:3-deoxy-8-phosphooctulonate synthase [Myxococcota bacterium]
MRNAMKIGTIPVGGGAPLVLIAGLNVIESEEATLSVARAVKALAAQHGFPLVFKASFDKANRSSLQSYRGPGIDEGLRVLAAVKRSVGLPIVTDVHEPAQAKRVAEVVDCLQIPAFLCRQTDLIAAAAATGLPLHLKKGQFLAPDDVRNAVAKARALGATGVLVTERGTTFGYQNLVVDLRALPVMRSFAPVGFDATHAVQHPGAEGVATGGDRRFVAPLARAATAVGLDALFVEVHPDPDRGPCDGPSQIDFPMLARLLTEVRTIDTALRALDGASRT